MPVSAESSYYPAGTAFRRATISKGKFVIPGPCLQPSMFMLRVDVDSVGKYVSDYFIVNSGVQEITCNVDSIREIRGIENKYMGEFKNFETAKEASDTGRGRFLLSYARAHPGSFIVLWGLIGELTGRGYEPVLDSAYHSLSGPVRNSFAGKVFAQKMAIMRALAVGRAFPELALLDTNLNKVKIVAASRRDKYVLVDFWDSHCGPCIVEFGELKKIYQENGPYGFAIVAVSIDDKKYIKSWKRVIREQQLPRPQYLDLGGGVGVFCKASSYKVFAG
ncbi:TlpA family protein disulfide reductase [Puia sp. P3]|uniref:TlpA family protein disulfide reductase n=1 Tax=Puia sp. P3 TaxID=3423952 RepID=UPI003D664B13